MKVKIRNKTCNKVWK